MHIKFDDTPQPSRWRKWHFPVVVLLVIATYLILSKPYRPAPFQKEEGAVFGTIYHITYQHNGSLHEGIKRELLRVDSSLSMFNEASVVSRINRNEDIVVDSLFKTIFTLSQRVSDATNGAFDITVAPLVNAWGFGFKHQQLPDSAAVDNLRSLVGWQRIRLTPEGRVEKDDDRIILDCSAVAKGFGVDVVAAYLQRQGVENYMVEIGGEVVVKGTNPKGQPWRVGVNKPIDDTTNVNNELETVITLTEGAMATSGNYRNFYVVDGKKLAHTIDPHTGYPVQHNVLSSTVIAPTCAIADAFATSFMVLGLDGAKQVLEKHPELQVFLIYDSLGTTRSFSTLK